LSDNVVNFDFLFYFTDIITFFIRVLFSILLAMHQFRDRIRRALEFEHLRREIIQFFNIPNDIPHQIQQPADPKQIEDNLNV